MYLAMREALAVAEGKEPPPIKVELKDGDISHFKNMKELEDKILSSAGVPSESVGLSNAVSGVSANSERKRRRRI